MVLLAGKLQLQVFQKYVVNLLLIRSVSFAGSHIQLLDWIEAREHIPLHARTTEPIFESDSLLMLDWGLKKFPSLPPSSWMHDSLHYGKLSFVKHLIRLPQFQKYQWDDMSLITAAGSGNVELVE